jgi:hypothetical protein
MFARSIAVFISLVFLFRLVFVIIIIIIIVVVVVVPAAAVVILFPIEWFQSIRQVPRFSTGTNVIEVRPRPAFVDSNPPLILHFNRTLAMWCAFAAVAA